MKLIEDLGYEYPKPTSKQKRRYGIYECTRCLTHFKTITDNVKRRGQKLCVSCANALKNTTHGMTNSRIHDIWCSMRQRCNDPNNEFFDRYGGRGIKVCNAWDDFSKFHDWAISHGYADNLSIDRIDNDGNYEPKNCQWISRVDNATKAANRLNYGKNKAIKLSFEDVAQILREHELGNYQKDIATKYGVSKGTVSNIVNGRYLKEELVKKLNSGEVVL